jgi:hypothetical protein
MNKRTPSLVWTLIALIVFSSVMRNMSLKNMMPPDFFDESSAEAKVRTNHLVQPQDIPKENTNSSASSKETESKRPPSLRYLATDVSSIRKEEVTAGQSSMEMDVNVSSSVKTLEATFSRVSEEQARVQPRVTFLQGSPWTSSPRNTTRVLKDSETKGYSAYTGRANKGVPRHLKNCELTWDWQKTSHPSCNDFHDTNLEEGFAANRLKMLGQGAYRLGFRLTHPHNDTQVVWKLSGARGKNHVEHEWKFLK